MNRRPILSSLGALAAAVALAACSAGAEPVESPETADPVADVPESSEPLDEAEDTLQSVPLDGIWMAWSMGGAELSFEFNVDPSDPRVSAAEELRSASAAEPVSYAIVDVDNRLGTELVNMYSTTIFDEAGGTYDIVPAGSWSEEEWGPQTEWNDDQTDYRNLDAAGDELSDTEYRALVELVEESDLSPEVSPGARAEVILVGPVELPGEATMIAVEASGAGEPAYAAPEEMIGEVSDDE